MRLFVGLPLPHMARESLASLQSGAPGARWVAPKNLHLTLRFIGDVDNGQAEDIDLALASIRSPAFQLTLVGVGHFGSGRRMRALWAGVERSQPLDHIHEKVESAVVRAGLPPEGRKFTPHVTLARFKRGAASKVGPYLEANNGFSLAPFQIQSFALFQSHLSHAGADYQILTTYPLD
ncbi:MAG TPA: RNA 2',3'-cyclic phosphodiesterase [Rhodospirillales bacterium]|nr:RNA 2',3'-cyclic phosphodiesterase [Rhodospirillales bacterium]